jgi:hypothetical protein
MNNGHYSTTCEFPTQAWRLATNIKVWDRPPSSNSDSSPIRSTPSAKWKAILNLPEAERENYGQTPAETYRLIDTTLNMVVIRLGGVLLHKNTQSLLVVILQLDNLREWQVYA